jgi:hypothetical protein
MSKNKNKNNEATKKSAENKVKIPISKAYSRHGATPMLLSHNEEHWSSLRKSWSEHGVELSEDKPIEDMKNAISGAAEPLWDVTRQTQLINNSTAHQGRKLVSVKITSPKGLKKGEWETQIMNIHFNTGLKYDKMIMPWHVRIFKFKRFRSVKAVYTVGFEPYLDLLHPITINSDAKTIHENASKAISATIPKTFIIKNIDVKIDQGVTGLGNLTEWMKIQVIKFKFNKKRRKAEHDVKMGRAPDQPHARSSYETIDD